MPSIESATGALASNATASIQAAERKSLEGVEDPKERAAIEAKFDLLELQAKNDAINLIIGTLTNMMNSNKNVASQITNNMK